MISNQSYVFCILTTVILVSSIALIFQNSNCSIATIKPNDRLTSSAAYRPMNTDFLSDLSFLPLHAVICENLFNAKKVTNKTHLLPAGVVIELNLLNEHLLANGPKRTEGYTAKYINSELLSIHLVKLPFVRTVCETGFNAGHSTVTYLAANPNVIVYSFDIGRHDYEKKMAKYIHERFPGRHTITWGSSVNTVKDFHKQYPDITCDLISIDGGHTTAVANADFNNFKEMASCRSLVLFDNYPQKTLNVELGKVWESKKRSGELVELFQCTHITAIYGISLGRYSFLNKCFT